jgi:hypothetical protein
MKFETTRILLKRMFDARYGLKDVVEANTVKLEPLTALTDTTLVELQKGNLVAYNGSNWVNLSAGTQSQTLVVDTGTTIGIKWDAAAGGDTNTDDYITGHTFNTTNGLLTSTRISGGTFSVDLDGRYLPTSGFTGFVDTTGSPANYNLAVFTDADTIIGRTSLTLDSDLTLRIDPTTNNKVVIGTSSNWFTLAEKAGYGSLLWFANYSGTTNDLITREGTLIPTELTYTPTGGIEINTFVNNGDEIIVGTESNLLTVANDEFSYLGADVRVMPIDKKWVVFGDSQVNSTTGDYIKNVIDILGLTGTVTNADGGDTVAQQQIVLDGLLAGDANYFDAYDIVSFHIGVNDFNADLELGFSDDPVSGSTFASHLMTFIETVLGATNPGIQMFLTTPTETDTLALPYRGVNSAGYTIEQMALLMAQICAKYSVQCIDLYSITQMNQLNMSVSAFTTDNLHINTTEGKEFVGQIVANAFLSKNNVANTFPSNDTLRRLKISQGKNSTATTFEIENTDVTLLSGEELGKIDFISNDSNLGSPTVVGRVSSELYDAGFWYGLTFSTYNSGLKPAIKIDNNQFVSVQREANEAKLTVERTGAAASQFDTKVSQGVIFDYTNGATGYKWQIESNDKFSITEAGTLQANDYGTGTISGTSTFLLGVDASGNIIEEAISGGGGSPLTTKGDLFTYDTDDARLPVGTHGQMLTASSGETTGLEWVDVPGSLPYEQSFTITSAQTNFYLTNAPVAAWVWLNGAAQDASTWGISGNNIVLSEASTSGDTLEVYYLTSAGVLELSGGTGDVNKVGIPVNNQIGVWTGDGTIEGSNDVTWDGSKFDINGSLEVTGIINSSGTDLEFYYGGTNFLGRWVADTGWADTVATTFFQNGLGATGGNVIYAGRYGQTMPRTLQMTQSFQVSDASSYTLVPAPVDIFEVVDNTTVVFSVGDNGVTTIQGDTTIDGADLIFDTGTYNMTLSPTTVTTSNKVITIPDTAGTMALTSDITGTNSGTNTGDQTSIVGITGTKAQFDTAVTDGDFVYQSDLPTLSRSITIPDPEAADDATMFFTPVAITVSDVRSHIEGATNVVFNISHASTRTGTALDVFSSDITLTSTAGQSNNSGFNDATIPANSWVWLDIVSVSGTPTLFHATVIYTED